MNDIIAALPFDYPDCPAPEAVSKPVLSLYIESFDGTRIALDAAVPDVPGPVPAVIMVTRDHRRNLQDFEARQMREFVKYGYAAVVVELRGCGVSFGVNDSFCDERHCRDLLAAVNWTAAPTGPLSSCAPVHWSLRISPPSVPW